MPRDGGIQLLEGCSRYIWRIAYNYIDAGDLKQGKEWLEKALEVAEVHAPGQVEMIKFSISRIEKEIKP